MRRGVGILALGLGLVFAAPAAAHRGPPYPVLVDRRIASYTLSVWADPDVGTGTFFVVFDPDPFRSASDPIVTIEARPSDGRLPPVHAGTVRQRDRAYRGEV